ncbi:MAG: hypothetical protein K2H76_01805 [Muribaculaceae bacterium]|nr:hypothetical protein [Muribaculaceae bacterium]
METERKIELDSEFVEKVPGYRALLFEANVENSETSSELKAELDSLAQEIASRYQVSQINSLPGIAATRKAYKACGKDPNRYRPSQEQMMRRIVRGLGLYNVNTLVDAGNLLSLKTGCSVGFFDADKVSGEVLRLGIGKEGEPYEGIGRGDLNISGLPVFRDNIGGIGTPTSDNERTKLSLPTKKLLATIHLFNQEIDPLEVVGLFTDIMTRHGNAENIRWSIFTA